MTEWDKLYLREESGQLSDAALENRVRLHTESARNAMSQSAAVGNLNATRIFEREVQARTPQISPRRK